MHSTSCSRLSITAYLDMLMVKRRLLGGGKSSQVAAALCLCVHALSPEAIAAPVHALPARLIVLRAPQLQPLRHRLPQRVVRHRHLFLFLRRHLLRGLSGGRCRRHVPRVAQRRLRLVSRIAS